MLSIGSVIQLNKFATHTAGCVCGVALELTSLY